MICEFSEEEIPQEGDLVKFSPQGDPIFGTSVGASGEELRHYIAIVPPRGAKKEWHVSWYTAYVSEVKEYPLGIVLSRSMLDQVYIPDFETSNYSAVLFGERVEFLYTGHLRKLET